MQRAKQSHIYLFRVGSHYKVGRSKNPKQRARLLFNSLPGLQVEIIHTFICEHVQAGEQLLHDHFADKRTQGEWFALEDSDVAWFVEEAEGYITQKLPI